MKKIIIAQSLLALLIIGAYFTYAKLNPSEIKSDRARKLFQNYHDTGSL